MVNVMPLVSVVIPTYNLIADLLDAIDSIRKQDYSSIEIIVVDNGSTDGTSETIKKHYSEVKLVTHKKNLGVTGGRNSGLKKAKGEYVLFFDHDMVADQEMVSELIKAIDSDSEIGIVAGKIYYWDNKKAIWSAGTGVNLISGQVFFRAGQDKGQFDCIEEIQVAPAVFLVKREVIKKIGGFDEIFFANWEDTDFCFRARKAGFKIFYTPKAIAYHKIPSEPKESMKRLLSRAYYIGKNRIIFMKKHSNHFRLFLLFMPIYIIYYAYLSLRFRRINGIKNFIKGTFSGLSTIAKFRLHSSNTIISSCPYCRTVKWADYFINSIKNPRKIGRESYNYIKCRECGIVYLNPMPIREELDRIYTETYDLYEENLNTFQNKIANLLSRPRDQYVKSVRESPGRILDIGCGVGAFLEKMVKVGWDAYGIEITEWAANKAKERVGKDKIFLKELNECRFPDKYFDVITLWHTLEHVDNPRLLIEEINRILKLNGIVIIEVPNVDSLSLRLFKSHYACNSIPEHLTYWSKKSLERLLYDSNFYINSVGYPLMLPLTFSRSFLLFFSEKSLTFIGKIMFLLSIPLSIVNAIIGSLTGTGEVIRICAKKKSDFKIFT